MEKKLTNAKAERMALLTEISKLRQQNQELLQKKNEYLDKLIVYAEKETSFQPSNVIKYQTIMVPLYGGLAKVN